MLTELAMKLVSKTNGKKQNAKTKTKTNKKRKIELGCLIHNSNSNLITHV